MAVPIEKVMPKNICSSSIDFLKKTLNVNINDRMSPEELSHFNFSTEKSDKQSTRTDLISVNSISDTKTSLFRSKNI